MNLLLERDSSVMREKGPEGHSASTLDISPLKSLLSSFLIGGRRLAGVSLSFRVVNDYKFLAREITSAAITNMSKGTHTYNILRRFRFPRALIVPFNLLSASVLQVGIEEKCHMLLKRWLTKSAQNSHLRRYTHMDTLTFFQLPQLDCTPLLPTSPNTHDPSTSLCYFSNCRHRCPCRSV